MGDKEDNTFPKELLLKEYCLHEDNYYKKVPT
jgi:hypothetical protein